MVLLEAIILGGASQTKKGKRTINKMKNAPKKVLNKEREFLDKFMEDENGKQLRKVIVG